MRIENALLYNSQTILTTTSSTVMDLRHMLGYVITASWTDSTPANKTFLDANVDVTANTVTIAAHGYTTGVKVTLTTDGVLPGGLALLTNYFLIVVNATTIKFATSYANAIAGTPVDITSAAGGGTHTVAVAVLAGGTVKLQFTNDDYSDPTVTPTWVDVTSSSTNITATGSTYYEKPDIYYPWAKLSTTLTAGLVVITARFNAKGA